jgi:hypothetical protein
MACVCASAIVAEMSDWIRLGGGNSGCCGNALHTYGFHLPASALPASDYSRRRDPAPPYNWDWACAGDFHHGGNPGLRARHAQVLARLMRGDFPMVCEFIGQPFPGKPIYYWARWDGIQTLKRYTGHGHDTWSHISWWRSRASQRAHLFTAPPPAPHPTPVTPVATHPAYPGHLITFNPGHFDPALRTWQTRMRQRGWTISADGYYGNQTRSVVTAFQREKQLTVDGIIGPQTWNAAWTSPVT